MFELLFILLPIAAAYGYYMGRQSARNKREDENLHKNTNYLHGVEYLLNNKQDKAVDKFIAYLNEADPSFENSLALGNLFRKRGEFDKAINMHQALSNNSRLEANEHEISKLELARDFVSAGLIDRAENILVELIDIPRMRVEAASLLVKLYERERDYPKAIEIALTYREYLGRNSLMRLAHYYCEVADVYFSQGEIKKAQSSYLSALEVDDNSIRACIGLCSVEIKQKNFKKACDYIKEITELDGNYGLICLSLLKQCFPNIADPNLRFELEQLVRRTKSASAMAFLVETVYQSSPEDAELMLLSFIKENPNLKLFSVLMSMRAKTENGKASETILQLKSLVDAQIARKVSYSCHNCGFESKILFWQCPSCRQWGSMRTIKGLDGD